MSHPETFGRRLVALSNAAEHVQLERSEAKREPFAAVDAAIEDALRQGMAGERVLELGERYDDETVTLCAADKEQLDVVSAHLDIEAMETRGAWALPDRATVEAGHANFSWWLRQEPRWVSSLAGDETRKVTLRGNPSATFAWAALGPVFEALNVPHQVRSVKAGKVPAKARDKQWALLDGLLSFAEIDLADELGVFRPGGGWSRLPVDDRVAARLRLADGWARHATEEHAARLRAWSLRELLGRFYSKAKKATPTSRQTLTKAHWRPLVAHFGGDWLAFLNYLGEQASTSEEIITSLPEPKVYVGAGDRAREAAAEAGVDPAEVEHMLASFFGGNDASSPVEQRVALLKRAWQAIDALHARQKPGDPLMWGLLDERDDPFDDRFEGYGFGLHRQFLPGELNREIEQMWGTAVIGRAPDRLVTRALPHAGLLDAFGPALDFWHRVALAAYGNTEGLTYWDYALIDLHDKYRDLLDEMTELGHPVDRGFFNELNTAARQLGEAFEEGDGSSSSVDVGHGLSIEISVSGPRQRRRREGFEQVRDLITTHRRAWAEQHLDGYLEARWQADLRAAAEAYNRSTIAKGKPPTVRQTITASQQTIDRWFGGDVGLLLTAIGQKAPSARPVYERVMPADVYALGPAVQQRLGLVEVPELSDVDLASGELDHQAIKANRDARQHNTYRHYAAAKAYDYIRLQEALGRPPEMKEVAGAKGSVEWISPEDPKAGWEQLKAAVTDVLAQLAHQAPPGPAAGPQVPAVPGPHEQPPSPPVPAASSESTPKAEPAVARSRFRRFLGR